MQTAQAGLYVVVLYARFWCTAHNARSLSKGRRRYRSDEFRCTIVGAYRNTPLRNPCGITNLVQKYGRHEAAFLLFLPNCSVEVCGSSSLTAALLNLVFAPLLAQKHSRKTAPELRDEDKAEANAATTVGGGAAETHCRPTEIGGIPPAPPTKHAIRTGCRPDRVRNRT